MTSPFGGRPPSHQPIASPTTVGIVPRTDIRGAIVKSVAKVSEIRASLLNLAAELHQVHGQADAAAVQLRAFTLGQLGGGMDKMLPTPADLEELLLLSRSVAALAEASKAIASRNPFDGGE